jgi:hypothetical protein
MTRPELPPGWTIRPNTFNPALLTLCRYESAFDGDTCRLRLVAKAWSIWAQQVPEWAAYLEQIESETDR